MSQELLLSAQFLQVAGNVALAVFVVATAGLVLSRMLGRYSAPLRHGILLAALCLACAAPLFVLGARRAQWGCLRVATPRHAARVAIDSIRARSARGPTSSRRSTAPGKLPRQGEPRATERNAARSVHTLAMPSWRAIGSCLCWLWLTFALARCGVLLGGMQRLRRYVQALRPCGNSEAHELLAWAARAVGLVRCPRLRESESIPVPMVVAAWNPIVVLPANLVGQLSSGKLGAVLLHETAHIAHGDLWVGGLQQLASIVFWWCPSIHGLNHQLRKLRETICDNYVLKSQGGGLELAEVLVELASRMPARRYALATLGIGALDQSRGLADRVERLLQWERQNTMTHMSWKARLATGAFAAVAGTIVIATTIRADDQPLPTAATVRAGGREQATSPEPPAAATTRAVAAQDQDAARPAATDEAPRRKAKEIGVEDLQAIHDALDWLLESQDQADGGWASQADSFASSDRSAATALAVLPFLGLGHTHKSGPYKAPLSKAISFLAAQVNRESGQAYGLGGTLYTQGLVAIALCRAYGLSDDEELAKPAQATLDFIMSAQDPVGGGWRYMPKMPGDTSVLGWQFEALEAGRAAGLRVAAETLDKAAQYLDSAQVDRDGATYGYTPHAAQSATCTAIGLLIRSRTGWKDDDPRILKGGDFVSESQAVDNLYFDYYAAQFLHNAQHPTWEGWHANVRELLLKSQVKDGNDRGSWLTSVEGGAIPKPGGRLYCTSMSAMILEVPLRERTKLD